MGMGDVQYHILSTVIRKPDIAYGAKIADEVSLILDRDVERREIMQAIGRMRLAGLIEQEVTIKRQARGGPRKYYGATENGKMILQTQDELRKAKVA